MSRFPHIIGVAGNCAVNLVVFLQKMVEVIPRLNSVVPGMQQVYIDYQVSILNLSVSVQRLFKAC